MDVFKLRNRCTDGTVTETEMTREQVAELQAGRPVAYYPRNERVRVEPDGTLVRIESAVPELPPAA